MTTVHVTADNGCYDIYIGSVIDRAGAQIAKSGAARVLIVTDSNVAPLLLKRVKELIETEGIRTEAVILPAGEASKSEKELFRIYEAALSAGLTRRDAFVALGGGVIGDICGFAEATFMRGIPFLQIPTTLLAQVDSSVGGKVAIDLPGAKNAVGAFYQPMAVLADTGTLATLDERQLAAGMAEVIKYAAIADASLTEHIEKRELDTIVERCCGIKAAYVAEDPYDRGRRMELNFGHTAGHGIEIASGLKYLHGEGVAIGMGIAARAGERMGLTAPGTAQEIGRLCRMYGLPERAENIGREAVLAAMRRDKKSDGKQINVVLIEKMGKAMAYRMTAEELLEQGKYE